MLRTDVTIIKNCLIPFAFAVAVAGTTVGCASRRTRPQAANPAPPAARSTASEAAIVPPPPELSSLPLSRELFEGARPAFVSHDGPNGYLALPLPYAPAEDLLKEVSKAVALKLRSRKEAHLTVISPPEFHDVLSPLLTMREIEIIAHDASLPRAEISPICLGRAQAYIQGKLNSVYYVVARSEAALEFRRDIAKRFLEKGGKKGAFDPDKFDPHVTVGFTNRDLHSEEDGVRKNVSSCAYLLSTED